MVARTSILSSKHGPARARSTHEPEPHGFHESAGVSGTKLFRKSSCACGGSCPTCQGKPSDLKLSHPSDPAEIDADRMANLVMRMPDNKVSPATMSGRDKDRGVADPESKAAPTPAIHPKLDSSAGITGIDRSIGERLASSSGKGFELDPGTRGFMESRFAMDLGSVRVHAGPDAAELNRDLSAKAFTFGSDIYFAEGNYRPETEPGKHLLAHELAHVGQGGSTVRRCADKKDEAVYDAKITEIKALQKYADLDPTPKDTADKIVVEGRAKDDCLYYAKKLQLLFTIEETSPADVAVKQRQKTADAVKTEEKRLTTDEAKKTLDVEELATADPEPEPLMEPDKDPPPPKKGARNWKTYPTRVGGGIYKVDATEVTNIYVKVKVNLVPKGAGTWDDVKQIKKLEDAIEKHGSRKGFTLNLEFVNPENDPAFVKDDETVEIPANPKWPTASSWTGNARTNAHELYHVLNFDLDRYNYIEDHAANPQMKIASRLHWFLEQMHKPEGYDNPDSLMGSGQYPIEEDICTIAQLDIPTCVKAREKLFPPPPPSLKLRTPLGFILPGVGFGSFGGTTAGFAGWGYDIGIPLTHDADWRLFIGAHGTLLAQLEGDKRLAFLLGARIGIEKSWSTPKSGGAVMGAFGEGGAAFVQDKESADASRRFLPGAYGYGGVNLGYRWPDQDLTVDAEFGGGVTSELGLHDPRTFVRDPEMVPFVTMGIRATFMFGGR